MARPCRSPMARAAPGDPAAIVAGADRVREVLGWQPKHENLDFIVETALNWERKLAQRNAAG